MKDHTQIPTKLTSPYYAFTGTVPPAPLPDEPNQPKGWRFSTTAADNFEPKKNYWPRAEFLKLPGKIPKIFISELAMTKIYVLMDAIELEVGWLGTAFRTGPENRDIRIEDIFIFTQDVSSGHTELDSDSMADIMLKVLDKPEGEHIFNNTRFWGHSHGSGGTYPSHQDDQTMDKFRKNNADFFLRGIFNRRGEINFSLYDYQRGIAFHEIAWEMLPEADDKQYTKEEYRKIQEELQDEMRTMVIYRPPPPPVYRPIYRRISRRGRKFIAKYSGVLGIQTSGDIETKLL